MLYINKLRADHVIDHAAEELKKYLRMMMPECGNVAIAYNPDAVEGFRLGLLEDFGLSTEEVEDPLLDDVLHIECTPEGGILAGSNPRSVLFSVYRFLRENGCRWLYPGVDGDYVPMKDIEAVSYHKKADHRFRGFCNEGAESQSCMLECADYYAKLEMNVYMLEWFIPQGYYERFYKHSYNSDSRIPEPVPNEQILQWKRQCEAEIAKRGLMFHDIGHGWMTRPFGLPYNNGVQTGELVLTEEQISVLAQIKGVRGVWKGNKYVFTNVCLSQEKVRTAIAKEVANYAETHANIDYLHVWLSDGSRNHCECEECLKKTPSDWYIMLMNQIDRELAAKGLNTRIVFIAYVDTMFAPLEERIENPQRFSLLYAPITRSYTASVTEDTPDVPAPAFVHNAWKNPVSVEEGLACLKAWQKVWDGPVFSYEYHFWRHQYLDPGGLELAKRLYEDIYALRLQGIDGYVEDGSQRSGWPNAFPVYIYAEALMNRDCDFEAVKADYFSHIYGEDWQEALSLLQNITTAFDFGYMEGEKSTDERISSYYDPERVQKLKVIFELAAQEEELARKHLVMPVRPQTVSWRLLLRHAEYIRGWAEIMVEKAQGHNFKATELAKAFFSSFGKYELEMERYYDHSLACRALELVTNKPKGIILE